MPCGSHVRTAGPGTAPQPRFPSDIGDQLFPASPAAEREAAVYGLIGGVCAARSPRIRRRCRCARICSSETFKDCGFAQTLSAVLPRRGHLLALSDSFITRRRSRASAGREWWSCFTAKRAEKFFWEDTGGRAINPNEWYLSPDHPDLEASPDMASFDRDYARYAVFWPAENGVQPATQQWSQDNVRREWQPAFFVPAEARVALGGNAQARRGFLYRVPQMHGPNGEHS